ncbi:MAG TPA: flippase [Solirubrobacteraceae bacterium]|nr:flippase [Solirubrobacteraceae bacterium]
MPGQATRQRAANDIVLQIVIRVANLALGVVVTALVVRALGRSGYGQWSTIFIVLTLVGYFANFGMETVALREAARDPEHEHEWIGAVMMLRFIVLGPVIVCSVAAILLLRQSHEMLVAGLILILTMPFSGVGALQLIFQLRVKNLVPMLVLTLRSVLWAIAVVIIYVQGYGMVALAIAMSATNAVGSIVQALAALRVADRIPRPSRRRLGPLVRASIPVGLSGVLIIAYARIDQVIVFSVVGSSGAGLYGSVYNVLDQSHFVPASILTTLAPVMAAAWPADRGRLLRSARMTAELMAIASFGALAFATVAATPLVRLIFGESFVKAAPVLPVLGCAFVFICFDYLNGNVLLVLGKQNALLRISMIALVVNVIGNLVFVPIDGYMGAAWMTLATEAVVFAASLALILRTLEMPLPRPGKIGRTALAALVLAAGLEAMRLASAPLAALVLAACVCYPALLFGLRAVGADELGVLLRRGTPL